jgi:hypothetical protein
MSKQQQLRKKLLSSMPPFKLLSPEPQLQQQVSVLPLHLWPLLWPERQGLLEHLQ